MFYRLVTTFALTTMISANALALPFVDMGIKLGHGSISLSHSDSAVQKRLDETETPLFTIGAVARMQVLMVQIEANALYWSESGEGDSSYKALSLPIIARLDFAPIPMLKLAAGTGLEFQFPLAAEDAEGNDVKDSFRQGMFLPLSVTADLTVPAIGTLGVEVRYGYELSTRLEEDGGISTDYFLLLGTYLF